METHGDTAAGVIGFDFGHNEYFQFMVASF